MRTAWSTRRRLAVLAGSLTALALMAPFPGRFGNPEAAARSAQPIVWAVGDGADGGARAKELAAQTLGGRVDRLLYLGDVYERGSLAEFRTNYAPIYGRLTRRTISTPGNHEWPRHRLGYDRYWLRATGTPRPPYYAVDVGGWRILSLNSETAHRRGSAQLAWLRGELARRRGTCKIAMWHRPRLSASKNNPDQPDVEPLWAAVLGRAAIVVNGHAHNSQRFPPVRGTTELVAGAGGHDPQRLNPDDHRPAFANDTEEAALRLLLSPNSAEFAYVSASGRVLDSGRIPCRRP